MTRQETIARLCLLQSIVSEDVFSHGLAADCICGEGGLYDSPSYDEARDYRNDGAALAFIEKAVRAALVEAGARRLLRSARRKRHESLEANARLGAEMIALLKRSKRKLP